MANELSNQFNGMFHDWNHFFNDFNHLTPFTQQLKSDVVASDKHYKVSVDVPGINKDDINLSYQGDTLTISATKQASKTDTDENGNILTRERSEGHIQRSYYLPGVDFNKINAKISDGVLQVTLPKSETSNNHRISID
ncbi:Hsp20/alpha crystallin family protein [Weissella sagaensis]|jgi:HSP20 family protein|uniref:Hsp20/alpha crystallin family protein n=1 Tax=Weissella sagaensis TaxID=2559928 RepID=UPI0011506C98|nr:Hsp20/alpha crystallin family protein [Weissella sagaensis]QDJ58775.1 Hsp20/alpha crystallin family protein [Weissella hellenica]